MKNDRILALLQVKKDAADFKEIGRTGLHRQGGTVQEEFLRDLQGSRGRKVFREMSQNDAVVGAVLFAIEQLARQVSWRVDPGGPEREDRERADFVSGATFGDMSLTWQDTLSEALTMLPFGWSLLEIVYKRRGGDSRDPASRSAFEDGRVGWRKWSVRAQESLYEWVFDAEGGVQAMVQQDPSSAGFFTIPIQKSLLFRTSVRKGSPEGASILRTCYRPWFFQRRIEEFEAVGIERDLAGYPVFQVAKEGPDIWNAADAAAVALKGDIETLVRSIRRNEQEGLLLPWWVDFKLVSTGSRRAFDTSSILQRYAQRIATAAMADFILLGHERVGSFALAQPLSARVLTPSGWTTMGAIKEGDSIICPEGYTSVVAGTFDHGVRPTYRVTLSDGRSVLADADHKWVVTTAHWRISGVPKRPWHFDLEGPRATWTSRDVVPEPYHLPGYGVVRTSELKTLVEAARGHRFHVPVCSPVEYAKQASLPIDPYIFGVLLGDGHLPSSRSGGVGGPEFCSMDDEIINEVERRLPVGHRLMPRPSDSRVRHFRISGPARAGSGKNEITNGLDALGLVGKTSYDKFVPDVCLTASIEERLWLLRGLMDTDGECGSGGDAHFSSVSVALRDGVLALVRSLGGQASSFSRTQPYTHTRVTGEVTSRNVTTWHVLVLLPEGVNPFFLSRKAKRVRSSLKSKQYTGVVKVERVGEEAVRCISVTSPSRMYVTDGFVPTHNSSSKTHLFSIALGTYLDSIADVVNRHAIPRLLALNGMPAKHPPRLVHGDVEAPDLQELGTYITQLAGAGFPLFPDDNLERALRATLLRAAASGGEEVAEAPSPTAKRLGGRQGSYRRAWRQVMGKEAAGDRVEDEAAEDRRLFVEAVRELRARLAEEVTTGDMRRI